MILGIWGLGAVNILSAKSYSSTESKPLINMEVIVVSAGNVTSGSMGKIYAGSFQLAKYEVTREQWEQVRTWVEKSEKRRYDSFAALEINDDTAKFPVTWISWLDAVRWCNALSEMEGLTPVYVLSDGTTVWRKGKAGRLRRNVGANGYRLPTEAEWELACRAGSDKRFFWGDDETIETVSRYAWYTKNSEKQPHPVGTVDPNPLGLYDMAGNASEWCWDSIAGNYRVWRGGSFATYPDELAASCRHSHGLATAGTADVGLRVAQNCD